MAVPKSTGTMVSWLDTNVMEHPCYIVFSYQNEMMVNKHSVAGDHAPVQ